MKSAIEWAEKGYLPDLAIRYGIRKLLRQRLDEIPTGNDEKLDNYKKNIIDNLKQLRIAIETQAANQQHYEVPAEFFQLCLGSHLKYSSCYYDFGAKTLDQAEIEMLELTAARADLVDGMSVLDLGCGWGSFSLWAAQKFPNCKITSMSNSHQQRQFIEDRARQNCLSNIEVITGDINELQSQKQFDRIISVEMFEHMRNFRELFAKVSTWLKPDGKMFVHIFCHKDTPYYFETEGEDNWMGAYFFTGGIMPSADLFEYFQEDLVLKKQWKVNGTNYSKTAQAWLENLDRNKTAAMQLFLAYHSPEEAQKWFHRWRIFFLACAELFGYNKGNEWWVGHYLFEHPRK